jgi:uncharacterized DUF497 family protein
VIIEFDLAKSERNARERGLPFDRADEFDWETAIYEEDVRRGYSERRFVALGYLGERLHMLCFTPVGGGVRIISFRIANRREVRGYEEKTIDR